MVNVRVKEIPGVGVTYLSDFKSHYDGNDFKHSASSINMSPPLVNFPEITVQDTLEAFEIVLMAGNDFISIGDGITSQGTYTIGVGGLTTVEQCFTAALTADRLDQGGLILLKSGTYNFNSTISLPAGVSVVGEIGGTIINVLTDNPVFQIAECSRVAIDNAGRYTDGQNINKFHNLTFFDNMGSPLPVLKTSSFIYGDKGSNIEIERCCFFGKKYSTDITNLAVSYNSLSFSLANTVLTIKNSSILGLQRAVQFDVDAGLDNKLIINNNKLWVSGSSGVTTKERSVISFAGSSVQISNNFIRTGISADNIDCLACCDTNPTMKSTVVITNNQMVSLFGNRVTNDIFKIPNYSSTGGQNIRSVISNNTSDAGNSSNSFYLTIGDGFTSVGDINGVNALQHLYDLFYQRNVTRFGSDFINHGEVTIYIKQGTYNIGNGYFDSRNKNLNFSLVGVLHHGNFPTIKMVQTAGTSGGNLSYLGNRLENLIFSSDTFYWRVKPTWYSFISNQSEAHTVVKNCFFRNAGIHLDHEGSSSSTVANSVFIENCDFINNTATLTNATYSERIAINAVLQNTNVFIKNCHTDGLYGKFCNFTNSSTSANNNIVIEDCFANSTAITSTDYFIDVRLCQSCTITNNKFNIRSTGSLIYCEARNSANTRFVCENNEIEVNSVTNNGTYGIRTSRFYNVHINNNNLKRIAFPIHINLGKISELTTSVENYNVQVSNNKLQLATEGYGAIVVIASGSVTYSNYSGQVVISKNYVDMIGANTPLTLSSYYDGLNTYGVIYSNVVVDKATIIDNTINTFQASSVTAAPEKECAICCMAARNSEISNNTVTCINYSNARNFYGIYCGKSTPESTIACGGNALIHNNNVTINTSVAYVSNDISGIVCQDVKYFTIKNNTVRVANDRKINSYIKGYSYDPTGSKADADLPVGFIENNILINDTISNIDEFAVTNTDYTTNKVSVNVVSQNNFNQLCKKEIPCFDFVVYGEDSSYETPQILASDATHATRGSFTSSDVSNMARYLNCINSSSYLGTYWNLYKGFYITNYNSNDAAAVNSSPPTHQLLIPINVPNYSKIENIYVPIFYWNQNAGTTATFTASLSVILGNKISFNSKIEYMTDFATQIVTTTIPPSTKSTELYAAINLVADYSSTIDLSPQRNFLASSGSSVDVIGPQQSLFAVLSMHTTVGGSLVKYAIPYCEVTFRY